MANTLNKRTNIAKDNGLETGHLETGCYLLKLRTQNDQITRKLLKAN